MTNTCTLVGAKICILYVFIKILYRFISGLLFSIGIEVNIICIGCDVIVRPVLGIVILRHLDHPCQFRFKSIDEPLTMDEDLDVC